MYQSLMDGFLSKIAGDKDTGNRSGVRLRFDKEKLKNFGIGYGAISGGVAIGGALGMAASIPIIRETLKADPTAKHPKETKKLMGSFMKNIKYTLRLILRVRLCFLSLGSGANFCNLKHVHRCSTQYSE